MILSFRERPAGLDRFKVLFCILLAFGMCIYSKLTLAYEPPQQLDVLRMVERADFVGVVELSSISVGSEWQGGPNFEPYYIRATIVMPLKGKYKEGYDIFLNFIQDSYESNFMPRPMILSRYLVFSSKGRVLPYAGSMLPVITGPANRINEFRDSFLKHGKKVGSFYIINEVAYTSSCSDYPGFFERCVKFTEPIISHVLANLPNSDRGFNSYSKGK